MGRKKSDIVLEDPANVVTGDSDKALKVLPELIWWLTSRTFSDGEDRQPGSLMVFHQDGVYKVRLVDKNASAVLWLASQSLDGTLQVAEAALASGTAQWRKDRVHAGDQAARIKKK